MLLAAAASAPAADGKLVAECVRKVAASSRVMGKDAEIIGVLACTGVSAGGGMETQEFADKVARISKCITKVSFHSDVKGDAADAVAAIACVGVVDTDETFKCLDAVERSFDYAKGDDAELLAARACANGNPAKETAACVRYVAFHLDAHGLEAETLAVQACGR